MRNLPEYSSRIEEIAGGRDNYLAEEWELRTWEYRRSFDVLKQKGIEPNKIFVGVCGFGADVLAAHQVWPDAQITALSVLDTPTNQVIETVGDKLSFQERTLIDYFKQADRDFSLRGFDLLTIFNTTTEEIRDPKFYYILRKVIAPKGYVFHCIYAGIPMDIERMNPFFEQKQLPERMVGEYWLWLCTI